MTIGRARPVPIRILIPDSGPLISLAIAGELDLLLRLADEVRIVVTDIVAWETTHRHAELPDAAAISAFLQANAPRVEVLETTVGRLALADLKRREEAGERAILSKDLGELSIGNAIISLRTHNPGEPTLVLVEDEWFAAHIVSDQGNVHLLSTSSFLQGLEEIGVIASAADVRARILQGRPHFRTEHLRDVPASKIEGGTEWRSSFGKKEP